MGLSNSRSHMMTWSQLQNDGHIWELAHITCGRAIETCGQTNCNAHKRRNHPQGIDEFELDRDYAKMMKKFIYSY